jgi:hypothetical protein
MWACPKCQSKVDDSLGRCGSCGRPPEGEEDPNYTPFPDSAPIGQGHVPPTCVHDRTWGYPPSTEGRSATRTMQCPMCQGEDFYDANMRPSRGWSYILIPVGFFREAQVCCRVCLACGFVAPNVTQKGLVAIRKKARWPWGKPREKSNKEELREL